MSYFIYCRKSEEDSGRQVQSIADQLKSSHDAANLACDIVVDEFEESMTAKRPGRAYI